ncbi:serine hydrolase, partial [Rhodopseudomonas sp. B29]|uniref:serine hydrolase domain-containing protein n=1 Tax=Rhodopseudomonas sp. B29 TaxID=95607 RepID=UPI0003B78B91
MTATAARSDAAPHTPQLPEAAPSELGLSLPRLRAMSDAYKREIDKGTIPGVTILVSRRGHIGWFEALGRQAPGSDAPMTKDTLFRIFSMTKPIVSVGIMQLVEDGLMQLGDPLQKYIPEFENSNVGVAKDGKLDLVPLNRPITIQDLLRHTSGITYEHTGDGPIHRLYRESRVRSRKISNEEHARLVAELPLVCQPGAGWNYSRSTDILGRVIEVVSGKTLGEYLEANILAPLQMTETAFHTPAANKHRLAQPFAADPWSGDPVALFDMTEKPVMESGGGGLVSTTMDYARFCQMLLSGGALDGVRIIGRKTLELMASNHLAAHIPPDNYILPPGHGFGLGFAVRTQAGIAPFPGSVGNFFWSGIAGTFFWIDPAEDLFRVFMSQGPGQREHFRVLTRIW